MTIYGEFDAQFRKKPALWRMLLIGLSSVLIGSVLVSLLVGAGIAILGRGSNPDAQAFVLYAPPVLLGSPVFDAAVGTLAGFPWIAGAVCLAIATIFVFFWPGNPTLASQLMLSAFAMAFVAFGAVMPAVESILARSSYLRDPMVIAGEIAVIVAAAVLAFLVERKVVGVLSNLVAMDSPSRRLALWLVRIAIPFTLLGALGWLEGSIATTAGAALVVVVTLLQDLSSRPAAVFLQLREVEMREAAATLPLVALLLFGGAIWLFGGVPGRENRAILWGKGSDFQFVAPADAWRPGGLARPIPRESTIRIEWSGK